MALRAFWFSLYQISTHFAVTLVSNVIAMLLSLPLLLALGITGYVTRSYSLIPLGIALLIAALPNPASAGLQMVARELSRHEHVTMRDIREGLRRYWLPALKIWLVSLPVTGVILLNVAFYAHIIGSKNTPLETVAAPLVALWTAALFFWLALHLFVYPLILAQETHGIRMTFRNAFVMAITRPLATCCTTAIWLALLFLTSATGLATVVGLIFGAAIQHNAFSRLLPVAERRRLA